MKNFQIIVTKDGSSSLYVKSMDETYHSHHGAIQEAKHVFIKNGIQLIKKNKIRVLEVGFGTGLNAILTSEFAKNEQKQIEYVGLETIPLANELISGLNYLEQEPTLSKKDFTLIHESQWDKTISINTNFYSLVSDKDMDFNQTTSCSQ